ncbi:MAG TPA: T9SS type A sorting domain-containing protein, partial [Bacteroidota bacterium]
TIPLTVLQGYPDRVVATISDPALLKGHIYLMSLYHDSSANATRWKLYDQTDGVLKYEGGSSMRPSWYNSYPTIDGIQLKVTDVEHDFEKFLCTANGVGPLNPADMAALAFYPGDFPQTSFDRPQVANMPGGGLWAFHTIPSSSNNSFARFKSLVTRDGALWPRISPNDFEIRFTSSGGKALLNSTGALIDVPFELWNIGVNSPSDPSDDYRMIPFVTDLDSNNAFNLVAKDHPVSGGPNDPYTDAIDFRNPLNTVPGALGYNAWVSAGGDSSQAGPEVMVNVLLVNFNGGDVSDSAWPANANQLMPASGTVYRILVSKPNLPGDSYQFVAPSNANGEYVRFGLLQNYPNPFNLSTKVPFSVQRESRVILEIYDLLGRNVRVLKDETMRPGSYEAEWNGLSDAGKTVSSGAYFIRLRSDEFVTTLKVAVLK